MKSLALLVLFFQAQSAPAASPTAVELCRQLGTQVPAKIAETCAELIAADDLLREKRADRERRERLLELSLDEIATLAKPRVARSEKLQSQWRELAKGRKFSVNELSCSSLKEYSEEPPYVVCSIPMGRGTIPTVCTYDGCTGERMTDLYFNFLMKDNGAPDERYPALKGEKGFYDLCYGPKECAG